jgi:hypothetical protein
MEREKCCNRVSPGLEVFFMAAPLDNVDRKAVKALIALFGPREAARQAGLNENTVLYWAARFGWKKATGKPELKDAGDLISEAVQRSKRMSTAHLAKFTERAAFEASEHKEPLKIAKQVRDVAGVYAAIFPHKESGGLIEGEILIGGATVSDVEDVGDRRLKIEDGAVIDLPSSICDLPSTDLEVEDGSDDVREEFPDGRPAGD